MESGRDGALAGPESVIGPGDDGAMELGRAERLKEIGRHLSALLDDPLEDLTADGSVDVLADAETVVRQAAAFQVHAMDAIDRKGLHKPDGHASVKVMARHVGKLSNGEASARAGVMKALRDMPCARAAYRAGELGTDQVRLLARVYANPRVRDQMPAADGVLVEDALSTDYREFQLLVRAWERLADADGAGEAAERGHERRTAGLVQDFDGGWVLRGEFGSLVGGAMREIFDHFVQAETLADWDKARAEHGEAATEADLPRTASQRRADAVFAIFQRGAAAPPGSKDPEVEVSIVIDEHSFYEQLQAMTGAEPADPEPGAHRHRRSGTWGGYDVDPQEAVAAALVGHVRRVVVNSAGTVIQRGRKARLFTGSAHKAVLMAHPTCFWKGCWVPGRDCQADHLTPYSHGGRSDPEDGGPLCGRHNRMKQQGYRTWRDPTGEWHILRPDGTEIR